MIEQLQTATDAVCGALALRCTALKETYMPFSSSRILPVGRSLASAVVVASAVLSTVAIAQVSPGAAAAASAGGSSASANGGTGGVGLGGVGPGVTINPGVNSGAGMGVQGREQGSGALSGPRARRDAQAVAAERGEAVPERAGQRSLMLDQTRREPLGSLSNQSGQPGLQPPSGRNSGSQ